MNKKDIEVKIIAKIAVDTNPVFDSRMELLEIFIVVTNNTSSECTLEKMCICVKDDKTETDDLIQKMCYKIPANDKQEFLFDMRYILRKENKDKTITAKAFANGKCFESINVPLSKLMRN